MPDSRSNAHSTTQGQQSGPIKVGRFMAAFEVMPAPGGCWLIKGRRGDVLGGVEWYAPWKQYVFQPQHNTEFSPDCLRALAAFMEAR